MANFKLGPSLARQSLNLYSNVKSVLSLAKKLNEEGADKKRESNILIMDK